MMIKKFSLVPVIITVLLMVGCATGVSSKFTKDNLQVFEARCNGLARSIGDCHAQASEKCGGQYDVMSADGTNSFVPMQGGYMPVNKRTLLFTCKASN